MSPFIPSTNPNAPGGTVANDGWFPDIDLSVFSDRTELGTTLGAERVKATVQSAMIMINAALSTWRAGQAAANLADVAAPSYGGVSEKVILYTSAVFARARAELLRTTRDYDSTKDGHNRADALEQVAQDYLRQSSEALARLTGRPRMIAELI